MKKLFLYLTVIVSFTACISDTNRKYPEVFISDPILRNDTVFVNIKDASYLTQGTGTMGAEIYLAESTYSYTEIPGVGFVNFKFLEGDHASPGTYVRKNFEFKK